RAGGGRGGGGGACDRRRSGGRGVRAYHNTGRETLPAGLKERGVRAPATPSPLNVFMNIPWTADGTLSWAEPVSPPGSYVRFRAEMDLIVAFSACPQDILPINGRTGTTTEAHSTIE